MIIKTYRQLLLLLKTIPEDNLEDTVTVYSSFDDEFTPTEFELCFSGEDNDVLDEGHPYLKVV